MLQSNRKISNTIHHEEKDNRQGKGYQIDNKKQKIAYFFIHDGHYYAQEKSTYTEQGKNDCEY